MNGFFIVCSVFALMLIVILWGEWHAYRKTPGVYMLYVPDDGMHEFRILSFHRTYRGAMRAKAKYEAPIFGRNIKAVSRQAATKFFEVSE